MAENAKRLTAGCPECERTLTLRRAPALGQIIHCGHCDTLLEIVNLHPLTVEMHDLLEEEADLWVNDRRRRQNERRRRHFDEAEEWHFYSRR